MNKSSIIITFFNCVLNVAIILLIGLFIASFRLPIFSNQLYVNPSIHIFNPVDPGSELTYEFTVRNLHPWCVNIIGIAGDCGCTRGFFDKKPPFVLYPLESAKINVGINTAGKIGVFEEVARIITKDNRQGTPIALIAIVR